MKPETERFHLNSLALYQRNMYATLLYPHHVVTEIPAIYLFYDEAEAPYEQMRGYLAIKEFENKKTKYFIDEKIIDSLPVRVNTQQEVFFKENTNKKQIIQKPITITPFRIIPAETYGSFREFVDQFCDFEHSNPEDFLILKICAIMGYVGKVFLGISSPAEFGKSAIYEVVHSLTQKSPVFQPRSIPGVLIQLTGDGNIVFDEAHQSSAEVKRCMENITLQIAGNKPIYINGAIKSNLTKTRYDVAHQSITFLYNLYDYYKSPETEFFDNFFSDNKAIDSRVLKLRLDGKLNEVFNTSFNVVKTAEDNKLFYVNIAKYLLWLQQLKLRNGYTRKYPIGNALNLFGRKKIIYDELTWAIDMYAQSAQEFYHFIDVLDRSISNYQKMLSDTFSYAPPPELVKEEVISENIFDTNLLHWTHCTVKDCKEVECNIAENNLLFCKNHWNNGKGIIPEEKNGNTNKE